MHRPPTRNLRLIPLGLAAALYGGLTVAEEGKTIHAPDQSVAPAEQSNTTPAATQHQADTIKQPITPTAVPAVPTEQGMPVTKHQAEVLAGFDAADANRDGMLDRSEYDKHIQDRARDSNTEMGSAPKHADR